MRMLRRLLMTAVPVTLAIGACADDKGTSGTGSGGTAGMAGTAGGTSGSSGSAGEAGMAGGAGTTTGGQGGGAGMGGAAGGDAAAGAGGTAGMGGGGMDGGGGVDAGPPATITPGAADRFLLIGTVLTPTGPLDGEVLVEGTDITCVAASCSGEPGASGATTVDTNGIILPGLIDSHNHGLFNIFNEDDWTPTQLYTNHNQWTNETRYGEVVDAKQFLENGTSGADVRCEMAKYAEVKAVIAGTTSFLMAPGAAQPSCFQSVVRTIDTTHNDLPDDKIQTSISVPSNSTANKVCNNFFDGDTESYVVHIGEGIDMTARAEFDRLINRGNMTDCMLPGGDCAGCLNSDKVTIVHGTALTSAEFTTMANTGMKLVWSPKSNMFLYDATTPIDVAIAAGVQTIALAPDWGLGGSINMLDELRFADQIDAQQFGDILTPERLFDMVTIDAAIALAVDQYVGSLEVGKRADIAIIGGNPQNPYASLLAATPATMRLVMVDGRVLYGDLALEAAGPATPGCEMLPVCGVDKFLCLAEDSTANKLDQTLTEVVSTLEAETLAYQMAQGIAPLNPIAPLTDCP